MKKNEMKKEDLIQLIDNHPGSMIISDLEGRILAINTKLADVFQTNRDQLIGKSGFDNIDDEARKRRGKIISEVIRTKQEKELIDHERNRWWKAKFVPILNASNQVVKLAYYINDITKEKEEEIKAIHNKEKYYLSMQEQSSDLIAIVDAKGVATYISPSLKKILGFSLNERMNKNIFEITHPEETKQLENFFKNLMKKPGLSEIITHRLKDKNDEWHYLETIGNNQLHNKNINGIIITSRDVTQRECTVKKLIETKNYLDNVIKNSNEIIFALNKEYKVTVWNNAAERITGIKSRNIIKKDIHEFEFIENQADFLETIKNQFSNNERILDNLTIQSVYGVTHVLSPSITKIKDNNEMITDLVFICRDITFDLEIHGTILDGSSYIIEDITNRTTLNLCYRLIHKGKKVLFITRKPIEISQQYCTSSHLQILLMSKLKDDTYNTVKNPDELKDTIYDFIKKNKNHAIILDRTDYLLNISTFQMMFPALYEINDLIIKHKAIFFIRVNPNLFSEKEYALLKEEFKYLPSQQLGEVYLGEHLFEMLTYIHSENNMNKIINQNIILRKFNISKLTAQKRIEELVDKKLILSKKKGRSKHLYITLKGKELIKTKKNEE